MLSFYQGANTHTHTHTRAQSSGQPHAQPCAQPHGQPRRQGGAPAPYWQRRGGAAAFEARIPATQARHITSTTCARHGGRGGAGEEKRRRRRRRRERGGEGEEKTSPLSQLVLRLTQNEMTNNKPQGIATLAQTIWPNQTIYTGRQNDVLDWTEKIKRQNKLRCYLA